MHGIFITSDGEIEHGNEDEEVELLADDTTVKPIDHWQTRGYNYRWTQGIKDGVTFSDGIWPVRFFQFFFWCFGFLHEFAYVNRIHIVTGYCEIVVK